jgi:anti-sigma factor RsiW
VNAPIDAATLVAFADGRLGPAARREIEERVRADPALAAQVRAYAAQRAALHARFDPVLQEPVPAGMLPPSASGRLAARRLAAAAALVLIGAAAGSVATWAVVRREPGGAGVPADASASFARQAIVAHAAYARDLRRPVEIASEQEQQLVAWLSRRLGREIRVPSLEEQGLSLVGGRLLPGDVDRPAAQLMYETAGGERVTLFVRALGERSAPTAFRVSAEAGIVTFYWVDGDWGYALTGARERGQLLRAAKAVHDQLAAGR